MFERTILINLKRRPDRLATFFAQPQLADWPLAKIELFEAIDGHSAAFNPAWGNDRMRGAWGCWASHSAMLRKMLDEQAESVLILEDDAYLAPQFNERTEKFFAAVPDDWQCLMLGGQHRNGRPQTICPGVLRCLNCQRTHAYALRGEMIELVYRLYQGMTTGHIDHRLGPFCANYKTYAPDPFLFGQAGGKSDINGRHEGLRFWSNVALPRGQRVERRHHRHLTIKDTRDHAPCPQALQTATP